MSKEVLTGAQAIIRSLELIGVDTVFGLPGGAILPTYDPLMDSKKIRHILVRHEQGAGHAAEGYASASGRLGVCIATSGPGATNLVTAIADAHMDSVPLLAITGQVGSHLIGTDAFQEADIVGITMPITKHSFLVTDANDIAETIAAAQIIATTGRPGPVLVDITKDAQLGTCEFDWDAATPDLQAIDRSGQGFGTDALDLINKAQRPLTRRQTRFDGSASSKSLALGCCPRQCRVPLARGSRCCATTALGRWRMCWLPPSGMPVMGFPWSLASCRPSMRFRRCFASSGPVRPLCGCLMGECRRRVRCFASHDWPTPMSASCARLTPMRPLARA